MLYLPGKNQIFDPGLDYSVSRASRRRPVRQTARERMAHQVCAAAAHDLGENLTIIMNALHEAIEHDREHPARALLRDAQAAAGRCSRTIGALLNFSAEH